MRKVIFSVAALLILSAGANATTVGYVKDGSVSRNVYRFGTEKKQGQAIKLSREKLQALKGKTIDFVEIAVGSVQTTGKKIHAFISTSLDGTPIAEQDLKVNRALKRDKWTLSQPYTITGNEDALYIGYTAEIGTSYKMLVADGACDISGCNFAIQNGEWIDTYGTGMGSAYITIDVDGAPMYADAIAGRTNIDGYFKVKDNLGLSGNVLNAGTTAITSFDAVVSVDGTETTQHFEGLNIAPRTVYSFKLSSVTADSEGKKDVSIKITNVNGESSEQDLSDNVFSGSLYVYPENMERSFLVETFTGQDCGNCPSGHVAVNSAIGTAENAGMKFVEVSHHSGYYPDIFTMAEDGDYTFYYGLASGSSTGTYAPAVMVNRNADPSLSSFPVVNSTTGNALSLMQHALASKPYASLDLQTSWNENTRELTVKLGIKPHTDFPTDNMLFNVFLVQDGIKAYQSSGGDNYTHNGVFRGTVTGSSAGVALNDATPGKATVWEKTITVPEKIHSTFWTESMLRGENYVYNGTTTSKTVKADDTNIEAVISNMRVVAYVAEYDQSDCSRNVIFNCCEAKLGESYKQAAYDYSTGIESVENNSDKDPVIYIDGGKVRTNIDSGKILVYSISGIQLNSDAVLAKGTYIVKVVSGGKQTTKKIMVR